MYDIYTPRLGYTESLYTGDRKANTRYILPKQLLIYHLSLPPRRRNILVNLEFHSARSMAGGKELKMRSN